MRRFHTDTIGDRTEILLSPEETHHLRRVLRLSPGDLVVLNDNSGYDYLARLADDDGPRAVCRIEDRRPGRSELCVHVTVYQAVIKGDHFDYAVQKMTEGGAGAIVPFMAARCVRRPKREDNFIARAQRIAAEAAKQSERCVIPDVRPIVDFAQVVSCVHDVFTIFAWEREDRRSLRDLLAGGCPERAALVVGPEGGFTAEETKALTAAGAHAVSLGPRILRSETAALYALAQLEYACC